MQAIKKTIITNTNIKTMNKDFPEADTLVIANGKIEALGTQKEIFATQDIPNCEVLDLQGKVVYPGFIETHSHLDYYAINLQRVFCGTPCKTIKDVQETLKKKVQETKEDEWIIGYSYDDTAIQDKRHLNKHDLDSVSTKHPILVFHISVHIGYANSLAFEKLGITKESKVQGGTFVLDENNELDGRLEEYALFSNMDTLPTPNFEEYCNLIEQAIHEYNKVGITTYQIGGVGITNDAIETMASLLYLEKRHKLNARAYLQFLPDTMKELAKYSLWNFGSDYVKIGGLKSFTDGSIQGFTAALSKDYHTKSGYKGNVLFPQEEIDALIDEYHSKGIQIAIHTNGDQASEAVISAFEKAYEKNPRSDLRHMLIHAQMVSEEHLDRMKKIGIIPSFFGYHIYNWGDRHATIFLGLERTNRMDPAGSAVRKNMPFSLHMDTPVLPMSVLDSIQTAVTRESSSGVVYGEDQKITPYEALQAYTTYGALCAYCDENRGMIKPGYLADFVVLDQDIEKIDPHEIKNTKVCMTICGGKIVYQA